MGKMIRVLHIIGPMNHGGSEVNLKSVLTKLPGTGVEFYFTRYENRHGDIDEEIIDLGGKFVDLPPYENLLGYLKCFCKALEVTKFDIIQAHHPEFAGYMLPFAKRAGIGARFLHVHNTHWDCTEKGSRGIFFKSFGKRMTLNATTRGIAVSDDAAVYVFGNNWRTDHRFTVIHSGINFEPFRTKIDFNGVRHAFGIDGDAIVVGHVGSFEKQKNHVKIMEIGNELRKLNSNLRLLLVGEGSLRKEMMKIAHSLRLESNVVFMGVRKDIHRILGIMDLFLFPSLYEGLGQVVVQAQAAGIPCLISENVPKEAIIAKDIVKVMDLRKSAREWAETCLKLSKEAKPDKHLCLQKVLKSDFSLDVSVERFIKEYISAVRCQ